MVASQAGWSVTTSIEVGPSPCSGGVRRHRFSSHRRSTFHSPFVLSCFPTHLVFIPSLHVVYLTLCSSHVCVRNCLLLRLACFRLVCAGLILLPCFVAACTLYLCFLYFVLLHWFIGHLFCDAVPFCAYDCLSKVLCPLISALLRLTSMHQLHSPLDMVVRSFGLVWLPET